MLLLRTDMVSRVLPGALVFAVVVAIAPSASAQVETSAVTEESRSTPPAQEAPPPPPRRNPALYGAGLGTTIAGSVAVPVGFTVMMVGVADSLGQIGCIGDGCSHTSSGGDRTATIGLSVLVGGFVMLAVGIPMLVVGSKRATRGVAESPFVVRF